MVVAPRYFAKQIGLGGMMQVVNAFSSVQSSLSFIVSSYTSIAAWQAVTERLSGFEKRLSAIHHSTHDQRKIAAYQIYRAGDRRQSVFRRNFADYWRRARQSGSAMIRVVFFLIVVGAVALALFVWRAVAVRRHDPSPLVARVRSRAEELIGGDRLGAVGEGRP